MAKNKRQSLYMQVQDYFKNRIISGEMKENDRIPSEEELIAQFGVSRITVTNALAGLAEEGWIYRFPRRGSFVSGDLSQLIEKVNKTPLSPEEPKRLHARPEIPTLPIPSAIPAVSASAASAELQIGLLIQDIDSFYAIRLIKGIENALAERGYELVIMVTRRSKEIEERAIDQLIRMGVKGLLIYPVDAETYNDAILALKYRNFPFVLVDRYLPGVQTHYVSSANTVGARMAVSHLWELGHRKIAICSDIFLPTITAEDRIRGYMDELLDKGAMIDPVLMLTDIEFERDEYNVNKDHPLYRYISGMNATAYIAIHSKLGLIIANIARSIGLRVPEDVSIITFDDPLTGYEGPGSITHISQTEGQIGQKAAEILVDILEDEADLGSSLSYQKVIFPPKLEVRKSTGPLQIQVKQNHYSTKIDR